MSNFSENDFKNAKNDLKNSIESFENVIKTCEECMLGEKRTNMLDFLIKKREEIAKMLIPWRGILAVMEELERIEERLDKIEEKVRPGIIEVNSPDFVEVGLPINLDIKYDENLGVSGSAPAGYSGFSADYWNMIAAEAGSMTKNSENDVVEKDESEGDSTSYLRRGIDHEWKYS